MLSLRSSGIFDDIFGREVRKASGHANIFALYIFDFSIPQVFNLVLYTSLQG